MFFKHPEMTKIIEFLPFHDMPFNKAIGWQFKYTHPD